MKRHFPLAISLLVLPLLTLVTACGDHVTPAVQAPAPPDSSQASTAVDPVPQGPSLADLLQQRDSLSMQFDLKQQNLPLPSYYHKTWWASYYIRREALMAGVDTNGVVFLIHSYNCTSVGPCKCQAEIADLEVQVGDSAFLLHSSQKLEDSLWAAREAVQRDAYLSTGWQCSDYYLLIDRPLLLARLADGDIGDVHYFRSCGGKRKTRVQLVSRKDLAAMRDCAALGLVLQAIQQKRADHPAPLHATR